MRSFKWFAALLIVALAVTALPIASVSAQGDKQPVVGIIVRTVVNDPFQVTMSDSAAKKATELGMKPLQYAATGHGSVQEQQAIVEDLIQQKVAGILLAPLDTQALKAAMEEANKAGIPIVLFDSNPIEGAPFITAIGTDNVKAASLAADYLVKKFNGKAKVAQLEGEPGAQNALFRVKGFQDKLKETPGMEVVASQTGHWTTAGAMQAAENILQAHPDLDAIFASSDMMGVGALQALQAADKAGKTTLVTFDGIPEGLDLIKKGFSDGDVAQFPTKMGEMGIEILNDVITGKKKAEDYPKYIDSGATLVTKDTVDQFLADTYGIGAAPAAPSQDAITKEIESWKPASPMKPFTVGVVVKTLVNDPFQVTLAETAKKTVESLGGKAEILAATHQQVAEQVAMVEDLIEKKVDGLLLVPSGSEAIIPAVEKANAAGIPVVIADTASFGGDFITFLATDNIKASAGAAEYLIKKFNGKAKVAQLEGEPGGQTAADRVKGFQDKLKEAPGMELVASQTGHWTTAGGQSVTENILQANPDINAIFASSDMMGVGAAEAIKAAGKQGQVTLVTFDGLPEGVALIKQGASDGDMAQFPVRMGDWGAKVLGMVISGEKKPGDFPKYIDTGAEMVTAETADTYLKDTFGISPK